MPVIVATAPAGQFRTVPAKGVSAPNCVRVRATAVPNCERCGAPAVD